MKKILHVSSSPRGEASESTRLSRRIVDLLRQKEPATIVVERPLGDGAIAHIDRDYAMSQASAGDVAQMGTMAYSEILIRELEDADCVVIATPMHNLTVPSVLKAWIDHVVRARRTFRITGAGKVGTLSDRPVFVAIASGGQFSGERARQPDFLTPYLSAMLATIGLHNVVFFSVQGTSGPQTSVNEARSKAEGSLTAHFL
jgi:FMN-dependent NADH-azoreductase